MSGRAQDQANDVPEVDRQDEAPTPDAARPDLSSDPQVDLSGLSIRSIREMVAGVPPEPGDSLWLAMEADPRKGVLELVEGLGRRRAAQARERQRILKMRRHEMKLWDGGATIVAGVDEVGRGPLAGPVMAACVVFPREMALDGLNDSKKLTPERREELYDDILSTALAVGVGSASHETIDDINILHATLRAMRDAVNDLGL
ncbi:ribonuclease HII, partial [bacterium]|nr:ribonuclease HII [bacterium]